MDVLAYTSGDATGADTRNPSVTSASVTATNTKSASDTSSAAVVKGVNSAATVTVTALQGTNTGQGSKIRSSLSRSGIYVMLGLCVARFILSL